MLFDWFLTNDLTSASLRKNRFVMKEKIVDTTILSVSANLLNALKSSPQNFDSGSCIMYCFSILLEQHLLQLVLYCYTQGIFLLIHVTIISEFSIYISTVFSADRMLRGHLDLTASGVIRIRASCSSNCIFFRTSTYTFLGRQ